jgi:Flp pilus assembly protein TadD
MRLSPRFIAVWLMFAVMATAGCATLGLLETIESLLQQGKELYQAGRYDEALAKFQEVIKREPSSWPAYLYAARSYIAKGAWSSAIDNGRKAFDLAPAGEDVVPVFAEALLGGGRNSLARGQYAEAVSWLGEYVRLKPTDAQGYLDLGKAYWQSGQRPEALSAFRRVLELQPQQEEALRFLLGTQGR